MWKKFNKIFYHSRSSYQQIKFNFSSFEFRLNDQVLQIIQASESDIGNLLWLEKRAYGGKTPWMAEIFRKELQKRDSLYLTVYQEETLIAVIGMHLSEIDAHVTNITVDPKWQKKGLGTCLMKLMIDYAQQNGCQLVSLEVRADNKVAKKLYQKLGFTVNFVRPNYYQDVHKDGLNMVLHLAPDDKESD